MSLHKVFTPHAVWRHTAQNCWKLISTRNVHSVMHDLYNKRRFPHKFYIFLIEHFSYAIRWNHFEYHLKHLGRLLVSIKDVIRELPSSPVGGGVAFSDVTTPLVIVCSEWKLLCGEKTTQHMQIFLHFLSVLLYTRFQIRTLTKIRYRFRQI
jgi:hypothetical protein